MTRFSLCLALTLVLATPALAQPTPEQLEARLERLEGADRIAPLAALVEAYNRSDPEKAIGLGREALALLAQHSDPEVEVEVLYWMGISREALGDYKAVRTHAERIGEIAQRTGEAAHRASAAHLEGRADLRTGYLASAAQQLEAAVVEYRAAGDDVGAANAQNDLGTAYAQQGRLDEALALFRRAERLLGRLGDDAARARSFIGMGNINAMQGKPEDALRAYTAALEIEEKSGDFRRLTMLRINMGNVLDDLGRLDEALEMYRTARAQSHEAGYTWGVGASSANMGTLLHEQGDYAEALAAHEEAMQAFEKLGDRRSMATTLGNIGNTRMRQGDLDGAAEAHEEAMALFEQVGDRLGAARAMTNAGIVYQRNGSLELALQAYTRALEAAEAGGDSGVMMSAMNNIGAAQLKMGRPSEALATHRRALSTSQSAGNERSSALAQGGIAAALEALGEYEEALDSYAQTLAILERLDQKGDRAVTLGRMAAVHRAAGRPADALPLAQRAVALSDSIGDLNASRNAYEQLALIHEDLGEHAAALAAYKAFKVAHDSLYTTESHAVIADVQERYRTREQGQRIELLERRAQIQNLWRTGLGGGVFFLLVIAGLVFNGYRIKSRAHRQLTSAHDRVRTHEAQLEVQAVRLKELDEMKSRFFANISHELRTPLTLIRGHVEDVREARFGAVPHNAGRHLDAALSQTRRLQRLVEELLDLSRLQSNRMRLAAREHDLAAFLRRQTGLFESIAERRGIALTYRGPEAEVPVFFDEDKIEKVVTNLIGNALKFTPEGGRVVVELEPPASAEDESGAGAFATLRVSDTGPGIPAQAQARIFDRFFQVDGSSTRSAGGLGLGLALSRELVELHGGAIALQSAPGEGTTFVVSLPLGRDHFDDDELAQGGDGAAASAALVEAAVSMPTQEQTLPPGEAGETPGRAPTVLVVEDNAELRAYLADHLRTAYRVVEAGDGQEGLERARAERPDLVVADVMMPRLDGFGLLHALKKDDDLHVVPVVLLTARASAEDRLRGLEARADDYLAKPFSMHELEARVRNLIATRRSLRRAFEPNAVTVEARALELPEEEASFLERAHETIERRVAEASFTVQDLADDLCVSKRVLERRMKDLTGHTPAAYIRQVRLDRARRLIEAGAVATVGEAAQAVGFQHQGYFARLYRQTYGQSPAALVHGEAAAAASPA